jgi:amino acid adenylation domain-containing protein
MALIDTKTGNISADRFDAERTLISYLSEIAAEQPDAPAILLSDRVVSYAEFLERADQFAAEFQDKGAGPGEYVGLLMTRSFDCLAGMLGALRAGAGFVSLDPSYFSEEQISNIAVQVPFVAVLSEPKHAELGKTLTGAPIVVSTEVVAGSEQKTDGQWPMVKGSDAACMVFTSGTTGQPKGVILSNRALASYGLDQPVITIERHDIMLHTSSLGCDGGLIEILPAMLNGIALALVEEPKPSLKHIADTMVRHKVTVTWQYVGMHRMLLDHHIDAFKTMRLAIAGGDIVAAEDCQRLQAAHPHVKFANGYGPTETACLSLTQEVTPDLLNGEPIPIGKPMANEIAFVVDENFKELSDGEMGQLAIGGDGVASGYYKMPEKTAESFIEDPRAGHSGTVYLTGDLATRNADGRFMFEGRADRQIKLGGRRVELDGIAHVLRGCDGVQNALVEVVKSPVGDRRICAVFQPKPNMIMDHETFIRGVLEQAKKGVHPEMLPRVTMVLAELPISRMGKPDRKAIRELFEAKMSGNTTVSAPIAKADTAEVNKDDVRRVRKVILGIWNDILGCGPLADSATFFDAGGNSLKLIDVHARMEKAFCVSFDLTLLFEHPRLGDMATALAQLSASQDPVPAVEPAKKTTRQTDLPDDAIAIIGLAAKVPGADTLDEFWQHILNGDNLIQKFDPDELEDAADPAKRADPGYVPARSILKDVDQFDAKYFGILPSEAALMDPQARVFLELCVQALDDAGVDPARAQGPVGVFAGSSMSTYLLNNLMPDRGGLEKFTSGFQLENYTTLTGNMTDSLSTRVAFKLNLKGPAITVHTACSTSLTAIAQAVTSLRVGQSDVALAGGVSITFPQKRGYVTQEGGMSSPDGLCRPFDAQAGGTVFGHGAGVLVLKRLADAVADGDHIEAVIRGVGLNNDGADKISFTAPSVNGQADAVRAAHSDAGISPDTISFIECHGTATPLGDPIEIRALTQAFDSVSGPSKCALGSVKGNIGHLDAGAGVISVIKTARMLREARIPPVAHYQSPNPRIDFETGPFYVPTATMDWASDGPRRAGVSGFGIGGTNVHLVLEQAPDLPQSNDDAAALTEAVQVLPLSAKTAESLKEMSVALGQSLQAADAPALADVAYTLQEGRQTHAFRMAVAATTATDAATKLLASPAVRRAAPDSPRLVFMFPGQGAQYPGMGSGLYASEPEFAGWLDRGAEILQPTLGLNINQLLAFGDVSDDEAARALRDTRLTQPALFMVQYATARLWQSRGVNPDAMIGHSVGEFAAAAISGVLDFETALSIIATRGQLMQDQPEGAMLSVRSDLKTLQPLLVDGVDLAAANAPKLHVVAGPFDAIEAQEKRLAEAGLPARRLHTSHAFHSRMMDPVVPALRDAIGSVRLSAPSIPYISCVTGDWITEAQACDPAYWAGQARASVSFEAGLSKLAEDETPVLLEVGAGNTLSAFAAQTLSRDAQGGLFQSLPDHTRDRSDCEAMAQAMGGLWSAGVPIDWAQAGPRGHNKVSLPGTVFQRRSHWIEPVASVTPTVPAPAPAIAALQEIANPAPSVSVIVSDSMPASTPQLPRADRLTGELITMFSDLSGEELTTEDSGTPFLELGFDSLFMGQVAQALDKEFGITLTFRSLLSDYPSIDALTVHLDETLPADAPEPVQAAPIAVPAAVATPTSVAAPAMVAPPVAQPVSGDVASVIQSQMQTMQAIFAEQLRVVGSAPATAALPVAAPAQVAMPTVAMVEKTTAVAAQPKATPAKPAAFKVGRAPSLEGTDLTPQQQAFADDLSARYSAKFAKSKAHTQENRDTHADPRTVAGFRPEWKELTFPIVAAQSKGAYIDDIDGNRFVDLVNGFGLTAFGHSPDFVNKAVTEQLARGYAIGPQSDMAGPVARRFARMTGHERVTFCNTGSEAVMAAMRLARAVTGREKVVVFSDDYHGQFDEVLIKGKTRGGPPTALPIAPGIPRAAVSNMIVLGYGDEASLTWIAENIAEVAAVVVEPVQSRHPDLRPADFCRSLRKITAEGDAALVFDEVVTGFRTHARGMQGVWDIDPDLATYGKIFGGGMPVGALAGTSKFMDALDGGAWSYGDDSSPQVAPTFFAGTFVRHPLVIAAVDAVLEHLENDGAALWTDAADNAAALAARMNSILTRRGLPELVAQYSSWFVMQTTQYDPRAALLYPLLRLEGVHVLDGFCGFLTTEHGAAECDRIAEAFEKAVTALQSVGILAPKEGFVSDAPTQSLVEAKPVATGPVALTESQQEIWMTHQLGDLPAASFNEGMSVRLAGPLNVDRLHDALELLVARHDALRLRFARDGVTFQVTPAERPEVPLVDISGETDAKAALGEILAKDAALPFDIVVQDPVRMKLVRLSASEHVLLITAHHIVCDGWSYNTLITELSEIYAGRAESLSAAPSFSQFAQEQQARTPDNKTRAFWENVYATVPELPDLPTDRPRGEVKSFSGATVTEQIGIDVLKPVRRAGAKSGCTLFSTLFAALQLTLGRLSNTGDVVLGVPTGGQALLSDQSLVGHCVNFLPIRAAFDPGESARDHLARVASATRDALDHGDYTLGTLVRDLNTPRTLSRLPLTEVQFNLERMPEDLMFDDVTATIAPNPKAAVNYDLFFNMIEGKDGLRIDVDYNSALFDRETVVRWLGHFEMVLNGIAADADQRIETLPLLSAGQEIQQRDDFNATNMDFPQSAMIQDLLAQSVATRPEVIAVRDNTRQLSYRELDQESDVLAAHIQTCLPGNGARIGVALPRSAEMLVALLAVLKAGHCYVPLDPGQPQTRLRAVLEAARATGLIAQTNDLAGVTKGLNIQRIDPDGAPADGCPLAVEQDPTQAAYVIFTSGSTGVPKGVEIPHRAVVNFLTSMAQKPGMGPDDTVLAVTTVMFDIAVLELFLPLCVGGQVMIAPREDVLDGFALVKRLQQGDITAMQATPTLWAMLLEAGLKPTQNLKMLAGGEPLPQDLAETLTADGAELWNMYGPTETTIWSAVSHVDHGQPVTIGAPIGNTQLHVLDPGDQICPDGVIGELNIGGDGLAIGYFDRSDLTDAAFRMVSLGGQSRRLYRTGDLAVRLANGTIQVLGRQDTQIKMRGFRIELEEIETKLRGADGVAAAAVALKTRKNGDAQLVAYLVPDTGATVDPAVVADRLRQELPDYMVPKGWVMLASLPQTANAKLDRKALPDPDDTATVTPLKSIAQPKGELEQQIAGIWQSVLGMDEISVTDTLFAIGADSLSVFRIAARLMDAGLNLDARTVLAHPSIRELAKVAGDQKTAGKMPVRPSLKSFRSGARRGGTAAS